MNRLVCPSGAPYLYTMSVFVNVALPVPKADVFTYALPDDVVAVRGSRVLVPLGRRTVTGTIVEVDVAGRDDARMVLEVLDDAPSFPTNVLTLTRRIADYYMCSWGEVLNAALPSGLSPSSVVRIRLLRIVSDADLDDIARRAPKRAALLSALRDHVGDVTVAYLQKKLRSTIVSDQLLALQTDGWVEVRSSVEREARTRTQRVYSIAPELVQHEDRLRETLDTLDKRAPKQSLILGILYLAHIRNDGAMPKSTLLDEEGASASALEGLVAKGLATVEEIEFDVDAEGAFVSTSLAPRNEADLPLTDEQQQAVDSIIGGSGVFLLDGVTGSGKTLVYQRAIAAVLHQGKRALVLVPEISLTPQLGDRFKRMFGDDVAMIHSRLGVGERARTWKRIRDGEARVVLGARSAVFVPLQDVGLIIVDEEHEPSYKQDDPAPRYHGRDAAVLRGSIEQCTVVLGSATPSLESIQNARTGRYYHLRLTHRADHAVMPVVRTIDIREARKERTMHNAFSEEMLKSIQQRIERKEGSLVFLNRRGYSVQLLCEDCGDSPSCPNCDVSLTYHKASFALRCHYCGFSEPARTICHVCGGTDLRESGLGTQRVEEELIALLTSRMSAPAPADLSSAKGPLREGSVQRMDADTTGKRNAHRKLLEAFAKGDIDVLVGTQMIAKGLDIARVTFVGVVNADHSLHMSDFRAAERTAQLLIQVAGRAGRTAAKPGEVLIQTSSPDHPSIQAAVTNDMRPFVDAELALRNETKYPPFTRFIVIEISGFDEALVDDRANVIAALIPPYTDYMMRHPPVHPPIARLRNRYRRVIVIRNFKDADPSGALCRSLLRNAIEAYSDEHATSAVRVTIDIDASGTL